MRRRLLAGWALTTGLALTAAAQDFRATVNGRVTDTTRAAVTGASVRVQNVETGELAAVTTSTDGSYAIPFLRPGAYALAVRSEEHTSELQSRRDLVCRLLLEKKKQTL